MTEETKAKMREVLKRAREAAAASGIPKIRWTLDEVNQISKECHRMSPERHPTLTVIKRAQEILPKDRQKKNPTFGIVKIIQARWREIDEAVDNHTETTRDTRDGMGIDRAVDEEDRPPERAIEGYKPPLPPVRDSFPRLNGRPIVPLESCEAIVAALIEINQKALALKSITAQELQEITRNHIDAMRLRNLTIQACNSMTYFEELIRAASAY